ncbi:MAG TPA: hypothetical protein VL443_28690 [Cyclobacteriaceae bacterium]|jgi:uncharacterized protein YjbI with pentapeptide repeats|nr:hypothetical protein [Cyclobacteriaceae bacterium]
MKFAFFLFLLILNGTFANCQYVTHFHDTINIYNNPDGIDNRNTYIEDCRMTGVNQFGKGLLEIKLTRIDTLKAIYSNVSQMTNDTVLNATFQRCRFGDPLQKELRSFEHCRFGHTEFWACEFDSFILNGSSFKSLSISSCSFTNDSNLGGLIWTDTLVLMLNDLSKLKNNLVLSVDSGMTNVCFINTDIDKIDLTYENLHLFFPEWYSFEYKVVTYQELLNKFKTNGQFQSYEKLDKEFRECKYLKAYNDNPKWYNTYGFVLNWIDSFWWDYGYNKFQVIRNAIGLNLLFFIINLGLFKILLSDGYRIEKFATKNKEINKKYKGNELKKKLSKIPYIFLYTSYIFWGWKLDLNIISINRLGIFLYVLIQYLAGIICLGYIANFIITTRPLIF